MTLPPAQPSGSRDDLSPEGRERLRRDYEDGTWNVWPDETVLALLDRLDALERVAEAAERWDQANMAACIRGPVYTRSQEQRLATRALSEELSRLRALSAPAGEGQET